MSLKVVGTAYAHAEHDGTRFGGTLARGIFLIEFDFASGLRFALLAFGLFKTTRLGTNRCLLDLAGYSHVGSVAPYYRSVAGFEAFTGVASFSWRSLGRALA
jgi:hypothetical protein